ncbi:MAG: hypothetical protein AAGC57_00570 [Pseudomonadota bacterium]
MSEASAVRAAALGVGDVLAGLVAATGTVRYGYHADTGAPLSGQSTIRSVAAAWALAEAGQIFERPDWIAAADWALAGAVSIRGVARPEQALCLTEADGRATLGAAGLGVAAATVLGSEVWRARAEQLCRFVLEMRRRGGGFVMQIDAQSGAPLPKRSAHYDGEALLGLARLAGAGHVEAREAAEAAAGHLARRGHGVHDPSAWMVHALAALAECGEATRHTAYASRIVARIVAAPHYRKTGQTVSIALRLGALGAYLAAWGRADPTDAPPVRAIRNHAETDLSLLLASRLPDGAFMLAERDRRVRLDGLLHTLIALTALYRAETA